jgi:hypothetical protein
MSGFLEDWRKPWRLLHDVKTKSIERTLLPLIKQVRAVSSLLCPISITHRVRATSFITIREWEKAKKISLKFFSSFLLHSYRKFDGKQKSQTKVFLS